jgi:hypothetical protein
LALPWNASLIESTDGIAFAGGDALPRQTCQMEEIAAQRL